MRRPRRMMSPLRLSRPLSRKIPKRLSPAPVDTPHSRNTFQRRYQIADKRNSGLNIFFISFGVAALLASAVVISPYSQFGAYLRRTGRPVVRYGKVSVAIGLAVLATGLVLP